MLQKALVFFALLPLFACGAPEKKLLPESLRNVRFGKSPEAVRAARAAAQEVECPESYQGPELSCMGEENPAPGFAAASYRFRGGRLEAVILERAPATWESASFGENLALVPSREALGEPESTVEGYRSAIHHRVRWSWKKHEVHLHTMLMEGRVLAVLLEDEEIPEPMHVTTIGIYAPFAEAPALEGEAASFAEAEAKLDELAAWSRRRIALHDQIREGLVDGSTCGRVREFVEIPRAVCGALVEASREGETSAVGREALVAHVRSRGYQPFQGFMIARHADDLYEVVAMRRTEWGHVPSSGPRKLLRTTATTYESQGRFSLWVKKTGTERIETVNGFEETWDVIEEDELGTLVKRLFEADEGYETSEAARRLLAALLRESVV